MFLPQICQSVVSNGGKWLWQTRPTRMMLPQCIGYYRQNRSVATLMFTYGFKFLNQFSGEFPSSKDTL